MQNSKPTSKGWQSEKNCLYPQEIYIKLEKPSKLKFISMLCHQSKISSKVSIFINQPGEICLTKLGGFSFNDNKRSNYQAREKKTVKVDCECDKIKLVFEINYDNEINKFNQIGIIGLELFGEEISENKLKIMKLQEEIIKLENIKKKAVEEENYDLAKETNNQILQKKELIQKLKEGKDLEIDNINLNLDKEINEQERNNNIENDDINDKNEKKDIEPQEEGIVKRFVNRKKNVEKVSTGVSTNEKDINIRYNKPLNSDTKPIDVDKQKVGNTLTFSQMVEKELSSNSQFSPYNSPNDNNLNKKVNNKRDTTVLSEEDRDFINLINPFLPEEILSLLVSKNVKEIEKAINSIYDDLILYNDDKEYNVFISGISINDIVYTCSNICLYILKKNYIPPKIMIIDVMNIFLNNGNRYIEVIQVIKEFGECLISLLDYLGDSNQKLREKTEKIIFDYTKKTKSQNKIINLIINTPIKKNLIKSRNHLNGRYLMVSKIVYIGGYFKNNFENILKYAINGYALNKINVRDAALDIIITLYKYEGEKVHQYFQDSGLRPAQIKTIQDKLDEIDISNNKNKNEIINQNSNLINACEFCGYHKPHITKDELNIHQYKDCPMLMQCENCKQIIEISNLNNHLLNECDFKEKYIKCNRCKQVVEKESINEHQTSDNCFDVNEDKEKLCPLCHLNIITEDIWKIHFLENGCQANIRIVTPSTTNASNFNFNK